jgi:hypothetical protein
MGRTNKHLIRHKAKGGGKKWRPGPNDPIFEQSKPRAEKTNWRDSVADVFGKRSDVR